MTDSMSHAGSRADPLTWLLVYTKVRAESWTEINLRNQGFATLLPRMASRAGLVPLFPRYLFVGHRDEQRTVPLRNTLGVLYVVHCGGSPARVPVDVIDEIRARMNEQGVVQVERSVPVDPLFAKRQRDRVRALIKLADAGFRVRSA
jgi:hypothetical protein